MNVLITLPKHLIDAIVSGKKSYEMRHSKPAQMNLSEDGFFCVEKGTEYVRCWCRCDAILEVEASSVSPSSWSESLQVDEKYVEKYCAKGHKVYFWHILEVTQFEGKGIPRSELYVDHNPQQFAYCPLSYGRNY